MSILRTRVRRAAALALLGAIIVTAPAVADESIVTLDDSIVTLDDSIVPLEAGITPLAATEQVDGVEQITLSSDILFDTGKSELSDTAKAKIADLVADAPQGAEISVDGYTDDVPYERGNDVLSRERAQAVADAITAARTDVKPEVTGHGEANAVGDNTTPEGRAENRRVEIRYDG